MNIDVAFGIAMRNKKEYSLLMEATNTWMRNVSWMTIFIMMPCQTSFDFPNFIETRCTKSNIWKSIDNTFMITHQLLTLMYSILEPHDYYMKIDPDTLIIPRHLPIFLNKHKPEYFGSDEISIKNVRILSKRFNYAQGCVEGFSFRTLQILVNDMCIQKIGELHCKKKYCLNKLEDVAVGACISLHNISFTSHRCFFAWGPCNIYQPWTCEKKICEHTLSIHKLKNIEWYRLWWKFLSKF